MHYCCEEFSNALSSGEGVRNDERLYYIIRPNVYILDYTISTNQLMD